MPRDDSQETLTPVRIRCLLCQQETLYLGELSLTGIPEIEQYESMAPLAIPKGWALRKHVKTDAPYWVGPKCLKDEATEPSRMKRLRRGEACPKCSGRKLDVRHQTGREPGAVKTFEHMRLECCRCHYVFARAPLTPEPKEPKIP